MKNLKIFITTGTQLPFPRLIEAMNNWASLNPQATLIAQTAVPTDTKSKIQHDHVKTEDFLSPKQYQELVIWADVIVGHAGMGTIITGFEHQKPLILMPRQFSLGEHRNDHQLSTAEKFSKTSGITIVKNENELYQALELLENIVGFEIREFKNRNLLISNLKKAILE